MVSQTVSNWTRGAKKKKKTLPNQSFSSSHVGQIRESKTARTHGYIKKQLLIFSVTISNAHVKSVFGYHVCLASVC